MMTEKDIARFWSKVNKDGPIPPHRQELGKCWVWVKGKFSFGYGAFWIIPQRRNETAHKLSWMMVNGPIPDGKWILHKCDNPACCNPAHLFEGSHQENIDDMIKKGRQAKGATHFSATSPEKVVKGESHHKAKLTESDVCEIRKRKVSFGEANKTIARDYGVTRQLIRMIVVGKIWKHVK